jgi:hypothetical protein
VGKHRHSPRSTWFGSSYLSAPTAVVGHDNRIDLTEQDPQIVLHHPPHANSAGPSLPVMTAPTSRSLRTTVASSRLPQAGSRTLLLAVVGASAVAMMSLLARGVSWSGPRSTPRENSASAGSAAATAASSVMVMKAVTLSWVA